MPHISFDRAADYYDATRRFPEGVPERIRAAIVEATSAGVDARFLELGVGTGRIALPFIQSGADFTGVDLSPSMMARLQTKLAEAGGAGRVRLLQGDVTRLPLAGGVFDVAIAVHVLHLVDGWQTAVAEARRVLRRPGGRLVVAPAERAAGDSTSARLPVNRQWDTILHDLGVATEDFRPGLGRGQGARSADELAMYLDELGATTESLTLVEYEETPISPRSLAQRHIDRIYSGDWLLPAEIHAEAVARLRFWLDHVCPEPDHPVAGSAAFSAMIARW